MNPKKYPCPHCGEDLRENLFSREKIQATFQWEITKNTDEEGNKIIEVMTDTQNDEDGELQSHYCGNGFCRKDISENQLEKLGLAQY